MRRAIITILIALALGTLTTLIIAAALFARARIWPAHFRLVEVNTPDNDYNASQMQRAASTGITVWSRLVRSDLSTDASPSHAARAHWAHRLTTAGILHHGPLRATPTGSDRGVQEPNHNADDLSTSEALAAFIRRSDVKRGIMRVSFAGPPSCTVHLFDVGWPKPALTGWFLHGHIGPLAKIATTEGAILIDTPQPLPAHGDIGSAPNLHAFPITPMWTGFAINTLIFAASWWTLLFGFHTARHIRRRLKGTCTTCGYSREGLTPTAACPECGLASNAATPA